MKIESKIKRKGGSEITLDDTTYLFKPDKHGRHVAEVTDQAHIARFLGITEGYMLPDDSPELIPKSDSLDIFAGQETEEVAEDAEGEAETEVTTEEAAGQDAEEVAEEPPAPTPRKRRARKSAKAAE